MSARLPLLCALALAAPSVARADRREASLHAQLVGGALTVGDADAGDATATVALAGLAVRASYATRDTVQYDLALSLLRAGSARFPTHTFTPPGKPSLTGPYSVDGLVTRLDAGATFRLGVRWIPTARVAAGLQLHQRGDAEVMTGFATVTARAAEFDLAAVGTASLGLDHRLDRRLIVGAAAGASVAVALDGGLTRSFELTVHGAYYWYPRW